MNFNLDLSHCKSENLLRKPSIRQMLHSFINETDYPKCAMVQICLGIQFLLFSAVANWIQSCDRINSATFAASGDAQWYKDCKQREADDYECSLRPDSVWAKISALCWRIRLNKNNKNLQK